MALRDDPQVAKLLKTRSGKLGFATVMGLTLLQGFSACKMIVEMLDAWDYHAPGGRAEQLAPVKEPAAPLSERYGDCQTCFGRIDLRAKVCAYCRAENPHGVALDPAPVDDEVEDDEPAERPELVVDVAELLRP